MKLRTAVMAVAVTLAAAPSPAANVAESPLTFFEGRTESLGTVRIVTKKPFRSRAVGKGVIRADGSLELIQLIEDEGQQPRERRWRMHQVAPGRFAGTMSEAKGPITVDEVNGRYRFRFRMDGSVAVEQWLTPMPDGRTARTVTSIRKYGIRVGASDGIIRKLD